MAGVATVRKEYVQTSWEYCEITTWHSNEHNISTPHFEGMFGVYPLRMSNVVAGRTSWD